MSINDPNNCGEDNDDQCWAGNKDEVSFLPFKITNLATGRQVRSWHNDKGIYTGEGAPEPGDPGYGDCIWQHNEILSFTHDSLAVSDQLNDLGACIEFDEDCNGDGEDDCCWEDQKTFELIIE